MLRRNGLAYRDDTGLKVLHGVLMRILCRSGYLVEQRDRLLIVGKLCTRGVTLGDHRLIRLL
ncbi:hypothetical protein JZM24_00710 [Candidatus Sodalis endolongispinus]|uniref:Transposase n=1 Tax=Candidatus Sodalis endolongispinus TaxID=2812662 RepID=A0ABS5Y7S5_9GAMM|nr:hypothetical protein [Candidatus Sodalis endolongispinus]